MRSVAPIFPDPPELADVGVFGEGGTRIGELRPFRSSPMVYSGDSGRCEGLSSPLEEMLGGAEDCDDVRIDGNSSAIAEN